MSQFSDIMSQGISVGLDLMGEPFTVGAVELRGIPGSVVAQFEHQEFGLVQERVLQLTVRKSDLSAAGVVIVTRSRLTYSGVTFEVTDIEGADDAGDPHLVLTLRRPR